MSWGRVCTESMRTVATNLSSEPTESKIVTSCAVMTTRRCSIVRMMQFLRDKTDGTLVGTAESSFLKSRGWMPYRLHSSSFGTCATMLETLPRASSVVHRTSRPEPAAPPETVVPLEERSVRSSALAVSRLRSRARRSSSRSTEPDVRRAGPEEAGPPGARVGPRRSREANSPDAPRLGRVAASPSAELTRARSPAASVALGAAAGGEERFDDDGV